MSKSVKTVLVVNDFGYIEGGATRVAHESAIALSKQGKEVILFTAVSPVSEELESSQVRVVCTGQNDILHNSNRLQAFLQGIWNGKTKKAFIELIKTLDPKSTVIHVHTWTKGISSSIFKPAEKLGFKLAITVHDFNLVCPNGGLFNFKKRRICELKPLGAKCIFCDCDARKYYHKIFRVVRQQVQNHSIRRRKNISYIFISDFSRKQIMRRNSRMFKKTYFLENPINFDDRYKVDAMHNDTYLYIARITEDKGIRMFCEGVTRAGVKAMAFGVGILKDELEKQYPNVQFMGWFSKADMKQYVEKCRCLVFPSLYYEASPLTPLELQANGVPCIVADSNASVDKIKNGKTGFIYSGYDVEDLVSKIKNSQNDALIDNMSRYIYDNFDEKQYSAERHIQKLLKIYEDILKQS